MPLAPCTMLVFITWLSQHFRLIPIEVELFSPHKKKVLSILKTFFKATLCIRWYNFYLMHNRLPTILKVSSTWYNWLISLSSKLILKKRSR